MRNHAPVVAFLWVLLAGCDAATVPSASLVPTSPTPAIGLATPSPTTPAVATPRPTPRPTPPSAPPQPSGVDFFYKPSGDSVKITVTWERPTSEGGEVRVYGVT